MITQLNQKCVGQCVPAAVVCRPSKLPLGIVNHDSFWLAYWFLLYVKKEFSSSAASPSTSHQILIVVARAMRIYCFPSPGKTGCVTNGSQPILYEKV